MKNNQDLPGIHHAVVEGNKEELLKIILNGTEEVVNERDYVNMTPLHFSARYGNILLVKFPVVIVECFL